MAIKQSNTVLTSNFKVGEHSSTLLDRPEMLGQPVLMQTAYITFDDVPDAAGDSTFTFAAIPDGVYVQSMTIDLLDLFVGDTIIAEVDDTARALTYITSTDLNTSTGLTDASIAERTQINTTDDGDNTTFIVTLTKSTSSELTAGAVRIRVEYITTPKDTVEDKED